MAEPEAATKALELLLFDYRNTHARYVRKRREMRTWRLIGAAIAFVAGFAAIAAMYDFGSATGRVEALWAGAIYAAVMIARTSFLTVTTRSSRRELQHLKARLDHVGYYVGCNQRPTPLQDALLIQPDKPSGTYVVTFDGSDIDFDAYDRVFR